MSYKFINVFSTKTFFRNIIFCYISVTFKLRTKIPSKSFSKSFSLFIIPASFC
nr:MAG TPA: hypothetical protein [Caudoviricetes sp.]